MEESEQGGFVLDCASPDVFSSPMIGAMQKDNVIDLVGIDDRSRDSVVGKQSRIPSPAVTDISSGGRDEVKRTSRLRVGSHSRDDSMIPKPRTEEEDTVTASISFGDGFTEYMNPLCEQLEEEVEQSAKPAQRMQTPEAVQVLNKMLRPLGVKDQNVLDCYLRTGPKKLSPEPSKEYNIMVPAKHHVHGKENVVNFDAVRTKGSGVGLDDSSTDEELQHGGGDMGEERGDENHPSQEEPCVPEERNDRVVTIVSPVMHGRQNHEESDFVEPFTLNCVHKTAKRVVSPVSFNSGSPDDMPKANQESFSFGMGHNVCAANTTAEIVADKKEVEESGGESVDQPNPFATMLGKLREEPEALQSPVLGRSNSSRKSPSQCTPMNLISASGGDKGTPPERGTPHLGEGEVDRWIEHRGLTATMTTPTRKDLQKMWGALKHINEATAAYQDALRMNAQLHEELAELQEAERQARAEAEEGHRLATQEMERSEEISAQIVALSSGVYTMFQRCDEERRQLSLELDKAKEALSSNDAREFEALCKELDSIRLAEAEARTEAQQAKALAQEYKAKLDEMCSYQSPEDATVKSKVSYFEALAQHVTNSLGEHNTESSPLEEPQTGHRAPQTTPVDVDDTTTPYRIHAEALEAFRHTVDDQDQSTDSDSEYQVEEISVSPIDVDGISRSNLRQTIKARLLRLRTELQDAKDRLNHVEVGLHDPRKKKQHTKKQSVALSPPKSPANTLPPLDDRHQEEGEESISCVMATPSDSNNTDVVEDTFLPKSTGRWDNQGSSDEEDNEQFTISANMGIMGSSRSRFAQRIDATSTPQAKLMTPRMSAIKSTAHYTPRFSSTSSSRSPSMYMEPITRPRRGGYTTTRRSESDEREFRRRAAALKIHVSPYFKKTRAAVHGVTHTHDPVDTML